MRPSLKKHGQMPVRKVHVLSDKGRIQKAWKDGTKQGSSISTMMCNKGMGLCWGWVMMVVVVVEMVVLSIYYPHAE